MIYSIIFLVLWLVTSVITYGVLLGYYQREFPMLASEEYSRDAQHAALVAVLPLVGLLVALFSGKFKHGVQFSRSRNEETQ